MTAEISRIICFCILLVLSLMDIRCREIPAVVLILGDLSAVIYQIVFQQENIVVTVGGIAVGAIFFLISKATEEGIGYGDSFGILGLGIYLGLWKLMEVLAVTFFLLASGAIFALCLNKMSRKYALPFYPFLTAGYLIWVFIG
ncbi:MAG: prepilin peptidase [Lachnospiraceae bacterium]